MKQPGLARLIAQQKIVMAPGAYDALSARIIEQHGFPAVYLTGSGVTASLFARPDLGFLTLPDMCGVVRNICLAIGIPLIADAESGFGNAVNLTRTIREYERAGASAVHLEDQVVPKRFQGQDPPQVVPMEEHVEKIKLAVRSRESDEFLVIGRTDCLQRFGVEEAIRRANEYRKAGADMTFVHGLSVIEDLREVGRAVNGPKLLNYTALTLSDCSHLPTIAELQEWGFSVVIFAIEPLFASIRSLHAILSDLEAKGPTVALRAMMIGKADYDVILDSESYRALEEEHLPPQPSARES